MGELRLRYVQLIEDAHSYLGEEGAVLLINESKSLWDNLFKSVCLHEDTLSSQKNSTK